MVTVEPFYIRSIHLYHGETEFNRFYLTDSPEKLTALKENPMMLNFGQIKAIIGVFLVSQNRFKHVFKKLQLKRSILQEYSLVHTVSVEVFY